MKKYVLLAGVVALIAAYLWGYWPEHWRRAGLERELATAQARLTELESRDRLCLLEGKLLALIEAVESREFADARGRSTDFFDTVRTETSRQTSNDTRMALDEIDKTRDLVTTTLVQADPSVVSLLRSHLDRLRKALGQPVLIRVKTL